MVLRLVIIFLVSHITHLFPLVTAMSLTVTHDENGSANEHDANQAGLK